MAEEAQKPAAGEEKSPVFQTGMGAFDRAGFNKTLKETKPVTNIAPYDDIQVIYKYVEKPEKIHLNTKFNNVISTTAFDKFIMNNSLIY